MIAELHGKTGSVLGDLRSARSRARTQMLPMCIQELRASANTHYEQLPLLWCALAIIQ